MPFFQCTYTHGALHEEHYASSRASQNSFRFLTFVWWVGTLNIFVTWCIMKLIIRSGHEKMCTISNNPQIGCDIQATIVWDHDTFTPPSPAWTADIRQVNEFILSAPNSDSTICMPEQKLRWISPGYDFQSSTGQFRSACAHCSFSFLGFEDWVFQLEIAPCHTDRLIKVWMVDHRIKTLSWPACQKDPNPSKKLNGW